MKTLTDEEIIERARCRIHFVENQKGKHLALGFMCLATVLFPILGFFHIESKLAESSADFISEPTFTIGFLAGVMACAWVLFGTSAWIVFDEIFGTRLDRDRLLVKFAEQKDLPAGQP